MVSRLLNLFPKFCVLFILYIGVYVCQTKCHGCNVVIYSWYILPYIIIPFSVVFIPTMELQMKLCWHPSFFIFCVNLIIKVININIKKRAALTLVYWHKFIHPGQIINVIKTILRVELKIKQCLHSVIITQWLVHWIEKRAFCVQSTVLLSSLRGLTSWSDLVSIRDLEVSYSWVSGFGICRAARSSDQGA